MELTALCCGDAFLVLEGSEHVCLTYMVEEVIDEKDFMLNKMEEEQKIKF